MRGWLTLAAALGIGVLVYRRLLMPWHKGTRPTLSEQKKAAFGNQPPRYRVTQPGRKPSPWWVREQLKRSRGA